MGIDLKELLDTVFQDNIPTLFLSTDTGMEQTIFTQLTGVKSVLMSVDTLANTTIVVRALHAMCIPIKLS